MPEKPLKTTDVGDLWSKISGSFDALLCSSVYRLYYFLTLTILNCSLH